MGNKNKNIPVRSDKLLEAAASIEIKHELFVGPFPPPDMLQQYENIEKGIVDRIFKYAESEQEQRHRIENEKLSIEKREITVSFWVHCITNICITLMFVIMFAGGCYALFLGYGKTAIAIFAVPIGRMVIAMSQMHRKDATQKK